MQGDWRKEKLSIGCDCRIAFGAAEPPLTHCKGADPNAEGSMDHGGFMNHVHPHPAQKFSKTPTNHVDPQTVSNAPNTCVIYLHMILNGTRRVDQQMVCNTLSGKCWKDQGGQMDLLSSAGRRTSGDVAFAQQRERCYRGERYTPNTKATQQHPHRKIS